MPAGGEGDLTADTILEGGDLQHQGVEQLQVLRQAAARLRGKEAEGGVEPGSASLGKQLGAILRRKGVFSEQRMDAVFQRGTHRTQCHASARQFALVTQGSGGQPHRGGTADTKQSGKAVGVKLVGLVDVAHHELCLGGVGEQRVTACGFDLVGDPAPIADAFECDGGARGEA